MFLGWAAISAHPWDAAPVDPLAVALNERRAQVRSDSAEAKKVVAARWSRYESRLAVRKWAINRAWQNRKKEEAVYRQRMAAAQARRPVIVRTVYVQVGPAGAAAPAGAAPASGSAGGYTAPVSSGGSSSGASGPAYSPAPTAVPVAAAAPVAVSAPPIVSVGAAAPDTSSGAS